MNPSFPFLDLPGHRPANRADRERVVILGGGFAGFYAALAAEEHGRDLLDITVVSEHNHLLYTPFLSEAAAGTLEPRHVVVPLRGPLKQSRIVLGEAVGHDPNERTLWVRQATGAEILLGYDRLLVAPGSVSRTFPIPGLAQNGIGFKTLAEAIYLRNHVLQQLEYADAATTASERRARLNFVVVGGGYAGVEALAELEDLIHDALKLYPGLRGEAPRWILVEAFGRIFPEVGDDLSDYAMDQLRGRGIELRLNTQVTDARNNNVVLSDGEVIPSHTLIWTAGVRPHPSLDLLGLPRTERGQVVVDPEMRVGGWHRILAAGDAAAVPDPARPGMPCPPTAQHAIRQGQLAGRNLARMAQGLEPEPFRYKTLGVFVNLGRFKGVARFQDLCLRGFPAWAATRLYHLARIPGFGRKARVFADWSVDLMCKRDTSELGTLGHPEPLSDPHAR